MIRSSLLSAALLFSAFGLGCKSDPPPKKQRSVKEHRDVQVADAVAPATRPKVNSPAADARNALQTKLFNRVIARVEGEVDVDRITNAVAAATGAEIVNVRRGAIGMLSFEFKETDPPRDAAAQKALVEKLQAMGAFKSVEGEKVFTAK